MSSEGRVRSVDREIITSIGSRQQRRGRILSIRSGKRDDRPVVQLSRPNPNRVYNKTVQSLVLEAFTGPRPTGKWAAHRNDDRWDNRAENLYWATPSENAYDAVRNGRNHYANRDACKYGHPLTEDNVYLHRGARICRTCGRETARAYQERKRLALKEDRP